MSDDPLTATFDGYLRADGRREVRSIVIQETGGLSTIEEKSAGAYAKLGYYIQMASGDMKMDVAFAIIVMLAFLGLFLYYLVVVFEKMLVPWHVSQRSSVNGMMTMK